MGELNIIFPILGAALTALVVGAIFLFYGYKNHGPSASEYKLFKNLLAEIDNATIIANRLGKKYNTIQDELILNQFETNLRMLESIIESAQKVKPYAGDRYTIRSLSMLTKECHRRLKRSLKSFDSFAKGRKIKQSQSNGAFPEGCYFCSRPFDIVTFKIVKVKVDEKLEKPFACSICRKQLLRKKKVKVLHFMNEGKPVHWSVMPGYKPEEHFFSLNNPFPEHKKPVLALVYSKKDGNNESPKV